MMGLVKKDQIVTTETITTEQQNYCKNHVGCKERFLVRRQNPLDYYQHHHHHNSFTPRGRSKVSSRIKSSPIDDKDETKTIRRNRIKTSTTTTATKIDQQNGNSQQQIGYNLELNLPGENNNIKRIKRSLSSTRLEKEKSDEKNTKLLRKNQVQNSVLNQKPTSTTTTAVAGVLPPPTTVTTLPLRKINSGNLNKSDYSVIKLRKR